MKQFREYNGLSKENLATILKIETSVYENYENGKETPTIDIIEKLAKCYKVTVDEFYGYSPRLTVYDKSSEPVEDNVDEKLLKMSDLSWEEAQIIMYFRSIDEKDDIISEIIKRNFGDNDSH